MDDPRTGRPHGDHGTAAQAIDYALDAAEVAGDERAFLGAWRDGSACDGYPEFYAWLAARESPAGEAPGVGRTELTAAEETREID